MELKRTLVEKEGEIVRGEANELVVCWEATLGKIVARAKHATPVSIFLSVFLSFEGEAEGEGECYWVWLCFFEERVLSADKQATMEMTRGNDWIDRYGVDWRVWGWGLSPIV